MNLQSYSLIPNSPNWLPTHYLWSEGDVLVLVVLLAEGPPMHLVLHLVHLPVHLVHLTMHLGAHGVHQALPGATRPLVRPRVSPLVGCLVGCLVSFLVCGRVCPLLCFLVWFLVGSLLRFLGNLEVHGNHG